jgi:thiosulfate/3-mercaptopyruvate sulfurtransferase
MAISILTVEELQPLLGNNETTIVDCRAPELYEEAHIPGAVRLAWEDWCEIPRPPIKQILTSPGYWGALDDPERGQFGRRLEDLGVVRDSHIVVYSSARASKGRDGRIAWMLAYLGAPHVSILNGGFPAWLDANSPTEQGSKPAHRGAFEISIQEERRCVTADLVSTLNTNEFPLLIDTRSPKEFAGGLFWYQPRTGRIPGSRLLPFDAVYQPDGKHFVSAQDYATLLPDSFASAKSVATYCEVGVRAATVALLHEVYTGQVLRVYDGSMIEWSIDSRLPVERGSERR